MARTASFSPTSRWSAAEVAGRAFGTARRGYDPNEVRDFLEQLAGELEALARREEELRAQLAAAEEAARHPVLDEAALSAALGQRIGAVLRNAHEEAARIAQQAEEAAAAALRDAQTHATEVQVGAESQAAARIAEAELEANALRQHAQEEAGAALEAARAEGESLTERARDHGRTMLDQAQEARRRVLADMAQRRRAMTEQIEQFRAARDEIAGSVVGVRRSLDRIVDDLGRADDAARAAAAQAAHAHPAPATEGELVEEAERAAGELGVASGAPGEVTAAPQSAGQATGVPEPPGEMAGAPGEMAGEPGEMAGAPGAVTGAPGAVTGAPQYAGENTPPSALSVADIATVVSHPPAEGELPLPPGAEGVPPAPAPDAAETVGAPQPGGGLDVASDVEELFARLRAGHGEAGMRDGEPRVATEGVSAQERPTGGDAPGSAEAPAGGDPAGGDPPVGGGPVAEVPTTGDPAAHGDGVVATKDRASGARDNDPASAGEKRQAAAAVPGGRAAAVPGGQPESGDVDVVRESGETGAPAGVPAHTDPVPPSPDAAALAARDEALEPITTAMARRLKRALQDDQNRLLDRLRQGTGEWSDALLADEAAQRALYSKAAAGGVRDSIAAGNQFARALAGGRHSKTTSPDQRTVDAITEDLAATIVALLRRRLEDAEIPDAAERIGAAYREWRGERIERLAEDRAVEAFDAGVLAGAVRSKGLRWVRSEAGPGCADCEDNALAGDVPPGDEFPTGHLYPPAHPGCRCLVVPTAS